MIIISGVSCKMYSAQSFVIFLMKIKDILHYQYWTLLCHFGLFLQSRTSCSWTIWSRTIKNLSRIFYVRYAPGIRTWERFRTPIRHAFSYGIPHVFIVNQWTVTHSSVNHNGNMPYHVWKCMPYGNPQPVYYLNPHCSRSISIYIRYNQCWVIHFKGIFTLDFYLYILLS